MIFTATFASPKSAANTVTKCDFSWSGEVRGRSRQAVKEAITEQANKQSEVGDACVVEFDTDRGTARLMEVERVGVSRNIA